MQRNDRQVVTHLLAFFAGLIAAYFALPAFHRPVAVKDEVSARAEIPAVGMQEEAIVRAKPVEPSAVPQVPVQGGQLIVPVQGVLKSQLTDTYAQSRAENRAHNAIDIMAQEGTPVLAADDGEVTKLFDSQAGGITLYQFNLQRTRSYYYAHLQGYAPGIQEGRMLRKGEVIGYVGHTGNADPAGPHLHFAIHVLGPDGKWWGGEPINPYPELSKP